MDPSLRIIPAKQHKSASIEETAGTLGLHDTLRYGPRNLAVEIKDGSDIRPRLEKWDETHDNMKLTMQRNIYGIHAPIRLLMERQIASSGSLLPGMPQSNIHLDILMGRDEMIETADIFGDTESLAVPDIHREVMGRKRRS